MTTYNTMDKNEDVKTEINQSEEAIQFLNSSQLYALYSRRDETGKGSSLGAVFIIVNAAVGAGLLSFPQAFVFAGGVLGGLILEVALAVVMTLNLLVVVHATDITKSDSYQLMIRKLFGLPPAVIIQICIAVYTFGSCVTYIVIIGDQVEKLFELLPHDLNVRWYFDRKIWMAAIAILIVFPLCLFRNIRFLNWPSLVGVICCFYISLMTFVVYFIRDSAGKTENKFDVSHDPSWSFYTFFSAFPIFCFGYQCHLATVPVYSELKNPSVRRFVFIAIAAISICFTVYTLTGLFGFLTFGTEANADIILSYDARNYFVIVARIGLLISMTTSYPLLAFLGRSAVDGFVVQTIGLLARKWSWLIKLSVNTGKTQLFRLQLIALCWFVVSLILGIFVPSIEIVITPIGGVAAVFSIIFPGFIFVNIAMGGLENKRPNIWKQVAFSVYGTMLVFIGSFIGAYSACRGVLNVIYGK